MNPGDALTLTLSGNNSATFTFDGPTGLVDVPVATGRPGTATFSTIGTYNLVSAWAYKLLPHGFCRLRASRASCAS